MQTKVSTRSLTNTHLATATAFLFLANAFAFAGLPSLLATEVPGGVSTPAPEVSLRVPVKLTKNAAFADMSSTNPTGVPGAHEAKIASFVITANDSSTARITEIVLADSAVSPMGLNFENLKLKVGDVQYGQTIAVLNMTPGTYSFIPSPRIGIAKGKTAIVDVYADIKSGAPDVGIAAAGLSLPRRAIKAINKNGRAIGSLNEQPIALQTFYIVVAGNLTVTRSDDTAPSQQMVMGETDYELATFKLDAFAEDILVNDFIVSVSTTPSSTPTLRNLKLYVDDFQIGTTMSLLPTQPSSSTLPYTRTYYYSASFTGLNLVIPRDSSKKIVVKTDVTPYDDTVFDYQGSNAEFAAAVLPDAGGGAESVHAVGYSSGVPMTGTYLDFMIPGGYYLNDYPLFGNEMRVYRTKVIATFDPSSPSGASASSTEQVIGIFQLTNFANVGNYPAKITDLNVSLSSTGMVVAPSTTLNIYEDSVDPANLVGIYEFSVAGYPPGFRATRIHEGDFRDVDIDAGATKTFVVTLDTRDAGAGDTLAVSLFFDGNPYYPTYYGTLWSDGVTVKVNVIDNPPLPETLTY